MKTKILNGIKAILIVAGTTAGLSSCQNYSIDSQPVGDPKLECDALEQYDIEATGAGNIVFNVSANTPWKITVSTNDVEQSWCIPSPGMSSAAGLVSEITVSTTDNQKTTPRHATITITADNVEDGVTIKVIQAAKGNLSVYGAALTETFDLIPTAPKTLSIRSNKDWEIVCYDTWVHFSKIEGSASDDVTSIDVTVEDNAGGMKRDAVFSVRTTATDKIEGLTIKQLGATLEVDPAEAAKLQDLAAMPVTDQTVEIDVSTSMEWTATSDEEWLSSGLLVDGNTLKVTWKCNPTFESRTGTITLKAVDNSSINPVKLAVTQQTCVSYQTRAGVPQTDISILDSDGYIVLDPSRDVRIAFGNYKYGKFTWEFGNMTKGATANSLITELAVYGHEGDGAYPNANINLFNSAATNYQGGNVFRAAGAFGWIASNGGALDADAVTKLLAGTVGKIELTLSESATGNVHFKLVVDDIPALDMDGSPAATAWAETNTVSISTRFYSDNTGYAATIKSFKAEDLIY